MKESKLKEWYNNLHKDGCNSKKAVAEDIKQSENTLIYELFDELSLSGQRDMLDSLYLRYKNNKAIPVGQQQFKSLVEDEMEV